MKKVFKFVAGVMVISAIGKAIGGAIAASWLTEDVGKAVYNPSDWLTTDLMAFGLLAASAALFGYIAVRVWQGQE